MSLPIDIAYPSPVASSSMSECAFDDFDLDPMDIEITPPTPYSAPLDLAFSPSSFPVPSAMEWDAHSPPVGGMLHDDAWPAVDDAYCKDFTCCGLSLPNLHDLLQHYEDHHVARSASDDDSLLTSPVTPSTASPRSSVGPEGPQTPPPPSFPLTPTDSKPVGLGFLYPTFPLFDFPTGPQHPPYAPQIPTEYDVMTSFDPLDPNSPAYSVPPSLVSRPYQEKKEKPQGLGLTIPGSATVTSTPQPQLPDSTLLESGPHAGRKVKYGKDRKSKRDEELAEGRKREKPFKCKVPGCTKAYLNSNGLRYHMQKGTCVLSGPAPVDSD